MIERNDEYRSGYANGYADGIKEGRKKMLEELRADLGILSGEMPERTRIIADDLAVMRRQRNS